MATVDVKFDSREMKAILSVLEHRQIPFAASKSLNAVAYRAKDKVVGSLPSKFIIRNSWTVKGFIVKKSSKQNLEAVVGSRDKYMAEQELGTTKVRQSIPVGVRSSTREIVRRSQWPRRLKGRRYFIRAFGRTAGIFERLGARLKMLWAFEPTVKTKPRLEFQQQVESQVKQLPDVFRKEFEEAIRTAR